MKMYPVSPINNGWTFQLVAKISEQAYDMTGAVKQAQLSSDQFFCDIPLYWLVNRDPYNG